jgi:hypothetical protein
VGWGTHGDENASRARKGRSFRDGNAEEDKADHEPDGGHRVEAHDRRVVANGVDRRGRLRSQNRGDEPGIPGHRDQSRCRYPQQYALANNVDHPRNVILREENLIRPLDTWLVQEFSPLQRRQTIAKLVDQAAAGAPVAPTASDGPTVTPCDANLARYRTALEAGADPAVVATWIAESKPSVNAPKNANTPDSGEHVTPTAT